mmetsp:Transcript_30801/g.70640  ORF Transcript_30801/g.70640 Transcript_30801/m.70640 type:complete len:298 (-) Transcript_30801:3-896(-)
MLLLPIEVQQALSAPPLIVCLCAAIVWAIVLLGIWAFPFWSFEAKAEGADRLLSTLHASLATFCGLYVICAVHADCRRVSDETAVVYGFISLTASYLVVDFCSMLYVDVWRGWRDVDNGMIAHHVLMLSLYASMVTGAMANPHLYLGGCLLTMEASTPALNLIWLLRFQGKRESRSYAVAGILLLIIFFACRIVMLPSVCWHWYIDISCKNESIGLLIFNAIFYCLNVFWFTKLFSGAYTNGLFSTAFGLGTALVDAAGDSGEQGAEKLLLSEEVGAETSNGRAESSEPQSEDRRAV